MYVQHNIMTREEFVSDMKHITEWASTCNTKDQAKACLNMYQLKYNMMVSDNSIHNKDDCLFIGDAIGRFMATIEMRRRYVKERKEKLASVNN